MLKEPAIPTLLVLRLLNPWLESIQVGVATASIRGFLKLVHRKSTMNVMELRKALFSIWRKIDGPAGERALHMSSLLFDINKPVIARRRRHLTFTR